MEAKKEEPYKSIISCGMHVAGLALAPLGRPAMIFVDAGEELAVATVGKIPACPDSGSGDFKVLAGFALALEFFTEEEKQALFDIVLAGLKRKAAAKMAATSMTETSDSATVESTETGKEAVHG